MQPQEKNSYLGKEQQSRKCLWIKNIITPEKWEGKTHYRQWERRDKKMKKSYKKPKVQLNHWCPIQGRQKKEWRGIFFFFLKIAEAY